MLCLLAGQVSAEVDVRATYTLLAQYADYIEDADHTLTLDTLLSSGTQAWQRHQGDHINFRFTSSAYWFRVSLTNASSSNVHRLFVITYPLLDKVDIYLVNNGHIMRHVRAGDHLDFQEREIKSRYQAAALKFSPHSQNELYVRVASSSGMQVPMALWEQQAFNESQELNMLGYGFFFGALTIIAAYNLFLWCSIREIIYLYYVSFVLLFALSMASIEGYCYQFFWQNAPLWNDKSVAVFLSASLLFCLLFARGFLHLEKFNPRLDKIVSGLMIVIYLTLGISLLAPYRIAITIVILVSAVASIMCVIVGLLNYRAGNLSARYFNFAWLFLISSNLIYGMGHLAVLPRTFFVGNAIQIGEILEALLMSFALADRINLLRHEKNQALQHAAEVEKNAAYTLKNANQQLEQALILADEDRRQKDRFIMTISHELRTPLNAISASIDHLRETKAQDEQKYLQQFIKFGADRLTTQVENLLILAETAQTAIKPQVRLFYIEQLLRQLTRVTDAFLFNKPVSFSSTVENPQYAAFRGDDFLILRVLVPILENACKYTEQGEVKLHFHLSIDAIDVEISDTGPGIEASHQTLIFESFKQVSEGYQRTHEGLGIGLASSKSVAGILGARIRLESEFGKDSCFYIHVPAHYAADAPPMQLRALAGKALIVEDNVVNAKVLNALVSKLGLITELAENGAIAVQKTEQASFDIILMDLQMPIMDGFSAALAMRQKGVHCPIIAVTANINYEARMRCMEVGMNDIVAKPLHMDLLKEKLSQWMNVATR